MNLTFSLLTALYVIVLLAVIVLVIWALILSIRALRIYIAKNKFDSTTY